MAKITYDNKETLNAQPSIANKNKVSSNDMNEIKSVVNTNDDNIGNIDNLKTTTKSSIVGAVNELVDTQTYSTTEQVIGKWINNKPIYRKVFTGTTPSTNYTKFVDIPNLEKLVQGWGTVNISGSDTTIPFVNLINNKYFYFYASSDGIYTHFSADTYGNKPFVFIAEYTKTTD